MMNNGDLAGFLAVWGGFVGRHAHRVNGTTTMVKRAGITGAIAKV
jgi:hypothetical protein